MTRRGSSARRIVAGASAAVMIACLLLVGWHRATETHGRCAEHGDELHMESVAGVAPSAPSAPSDADTDQPQIDASSWAVEKGDHHCQILGTSHQPVTAEPHPPIVAVPPALDRATSIIPVAAAVAAVALYRLAPKTSPPV